MKKHKVIILCNCGNKIVPDSAIKEIQEKLKSGNTDVYELNDLCAVAINEKLELEDIEKNYSEKNVIACYPRAVKAIIEQNEVDFTNYLVFNLRENNVKSIIDEVKISYGNENKGVYKEIYSALKVPAWYPVIDKTRCTLCAKCADFCLFGVYKFNKRELKVVNPLSCKNNCPACGRNCPSSAIIFPKLPEKSMLSGADTDNMQNILNEDETLLSVLEKRNTKRKSILQEDVVNKAYRERKLALDELKLNNND